jgi:succinylarginine dihydrolase
MKIGHVLAFADVYASIKDQPMSVKTAYKFSKLANKLDAEQKFYQAKLQDIIATYVEKDSNGQLVHTEDGKAMKIIPGKEEECTTAMNELEDIDIDVEPILTIDELEGLSITPTQMQGLYPFIIED